jgi:proton glutamate symport protein
MSKAGIILISLIAGLLLGMNALGAPTVFKDAADVIGTSWLNGLRMTVVPLVVSLLIVGIVQTAEAAKAGKIAARGVVLMITILWLSSLMTAFAIPAFTGMFPMPAEAADALRKALGVAAAPEKIPPFSEFLRALVPTYLRAPLRLPLFAYPPKNGPAYCRCSKVWRTRWSSWLAGYWHSPLLAFLLWRLALA